MFRSVTYCGVALLAAIFLFGGDAPTAKAQGFSISIGTGGFVPGGFVPGGFAPGVVRHGSAFGYRSGFGYHPFGPAIVPSYGVRYQSGFRGGGLYHQPRVYYPAPVRIHPRSRSFYHPGFYGRW